MKRKIQWKKGCQKLLLFWMVFSQIFGQVPVKAGIAFKDMTGQEWYAKDVIALAENENHIITGFADGTFRAKTELTVDQFITMLIRALGHEIPINYEYWAVGAINQAFNLGIVQMGDFSDYRAKIRREQAALLLMRSLAQQTDLSKIQIEGVRESFLDHEYTGFLEEKYKKVPLLKDAMAYMIATGIMTGTPEGLLQAEGSLTRAEGAVILNRFLNPKRRIPFQKERILAAHEEEIKKHLFHGEKWVDPLNTKIPRMFRALEDRIITSSDLFYQPSAGETFSGEAYKPRYGEDEIIGRIMYDEKSAYKGHLEDFKRLLLRRMPQSEVEKAMKILEYKKDGYGRIEHDNSAIFLDNGKYLLVLENEIVNRIGIRDRVYFYLYYWDEQFKKEYQHRIPYLYFIK